MATATKKVDNKQVFESIDENQSVVKTQHNNKSGVDKPNSSTNAPPTTPSRLEKTSLSASTDIVSVLLKCEELLVYKLVTHQFTVILQSVETIQIIQ